MFTTASGLTIQIGCGLIRSLRGVARPAGLLGSPEGQGEGQELVRREHGRSRTQEEEQEEKEQDEKQEDEQQEDEQQDEQEKEEQEQEKEQSRGEVYSR